MSSSDSAVTYTSISSENVPFWCIRFFGMEQPDPPEAAPQSPIQTPPVPHDEDEQLDPEEDPEEYEDDESEDGLVDYPMDGGDDGDNDDGDSSGYDADDEDEEEEHLALTDSAVVVPAIELVASLEGTEPVIPPPSTDIATTGARITGISEVGYGIRDTWVDPAEAVPEIAPMTLGEVNTRVTELAELYEHDTQDLYALLEDAQDSVCIQVLALGTSDAATTTGYSYLDITPAVTRQGPNVPPNNANPNNMTLESVQAMIDQALLRNSTNEDGSYKTKGVVGLTQWIEKMESVFQIRGCAIENQEVLKKKMTDKYCPYGEIKKLEIELWNIKFVANETEKIDKYVSRLLDNIYESVKASKPKTLDETIELANDLMD
nr:hypothetical protein [Tanacetum cinerariifolium]